MNYKVFYILKPVIPRSFQLYVRRKIIRYKLPKIANVWPILIGSEKKPENWQGWPDGKTFALIITHDVESKRGYDRVLRLMEIEKELGFVSAFYFIPERDYTVEKYVLDNLRKNGFEYGIHGLYHDGKLFTSEKEFLIRANRINMYLKDWGAVGFRAPSMHHNLDWIGALNINYDLSTFDTDPFEPQSDGVKTIFPFWVENKRHENGGYIELPYTLPQDCTLFVLMEEESPKIWIDKLDWIAENKGMALINVHPDYVNFNCKKRSEEYPLDIYLKFLYYIKTNYSEKYWNVIPKEMSTLFKPNLIYRLEVNANSDDCI